MIGTMHIQYLVVRIGGATTFASAKVKNAIGRIGIFLDEFCVFQRRNRIWSWSVRKKNGN